MKRLIKKTKIYKFFFNIVQQLQECNRKADEITSNNQKYMLEIQDRFKDIEDKLRDLNIKLVNSVTQINSICQENSDSLSDSLLININQLKDIGTTICNRTKQLECVNMELLLLRGNNKIQKILIVGFYGAPNLGDELMLEAVLEHIGGYDDIEITVMIADNPNYSTTRYGNVNFIHYPKTNMDFHIIAQYFDKIIFGGGALLDDSKWGDFYFDNISLYNILINLSIAAINLNKYVYLVGLSSANTLKNKKYIDNLNYVINNAKYVSLRDTNSLAVLNDSRVNCSKINIIDDLIYGIDYEKKITNSNENSFTVGMVLVSYTDIEVLLDMVKQIEKYLLLKTEKKKRIKLIPFYMYMDSDLNKYREIVDKITLDKSIEIEIEQYVNMYKEIVEEFNGCDILISMRYHASLIALREQIPAIHVVYDVHSHYINKMNYLLERYGSNDNSIMLSEYDGNVLFDKIVNYCCGKRYTPSTNFDELFGDIVKKN